MQTLLFCVWVHHGLLLNYFSWSIILGEGQNLCQGILSCRIKLLRGIRKHSVKVRVFVLLGAAHLMDPLNLSSRFQLFGGILFFIWALNFPVGGNELHLAAAGVHFVT